MDPKPDIVIRNGQIIDGSGGKTLRVRPSDNRWFNHPN